MPLSRAETCSCFRMMEYDRKLMEVIGADFVVLQSQAEPGVINCRVAISRDSRNLVPAMCGSLRPTFQ